jgi:predicted  nucleic acid-binding Zn-ribbon protein
MARLTVVLASLALIGTGVVGVAAFAPESLPPQLSAYMSTRQARVTPEQLKTVTDRLDRLAGNLEKVQQAQTDQAAAISSLSEAQKQAAERITTAMGLATSKSQDDATQQRAIGDLHQANATMQRQIAELQKAVAGMRRTVGAALTAPTAAPAKPSAQRPAQH